MAEYLPTSELPVVKIANPHFPNFLFEWHTQGEKREADGEVYVIAIPGRFVDGVFVRDLGTHKAMGFKLAEHCDSHARFIGFVQTYLRGYKQGLADAKLLAQGEARIELGHDQGGPAPFSAGRINSATAHA